ncbi:MAG: PilZ domain-containing protein [Gemmataceae bacterium]
MNTRFDCAVPTTCQPPSSWAKDPWHAVIRNISASGMCLTLQRRFEPGSGLAIELPADDGSHSTVLARVAHVQAYEGGGWILGVKLISELSEEEIAQVLNLSTLHSAALEDGSVRPAVVTRKGVLFDTRFETPQGERRLAWFVKQLDHSGQWPIPAEKHLTFRCERGVLKMQTVKTTPFGPYWILKCKLTAAPSAEILAHLSKQPKDSDAMAS